MEKHKSELEFTSNATEILKILVHSKTNGNVVGIGSPLLGAGVFITAVEKVVLDYETIIYLKPYDVNGHILGTNTLKLTDITCACSFKSQFEKLYHQTPETEFHAATY
ncbi:MAG: hypothetical protein ACOYXT_22625 [Bacteroidota bacterium]